MNQDALSTRIVKKRCMYKVHEQLRDVNENAYKPVLLAIGPYYDQDKVGHGFMIEHKLHYKQQMLRAKGSEERYMRALRELKESARKCYVECNSQTSDDQFLKTMLLDGCFIIELFRKYEKYKKTRDEDDPIISTDEQFLKYEPQDPTGEYDPVISSNEQSPKYELQYRIDEGDPIVSTEQSPRYEAHDLTDEDDPIFQMKWVLPRIARDLLLFENQLPFFILAKLFEMSEGNETQIHKRPENSGELILEIEEKDRISVESSTSTNDQIIPTRLNDLALGFFSDFLPFQWNAHASSYNSIEKIKDLLCLTHKPLTPSLPVMVWKRLGLGFRFENTKFEHLLGLIHATISISILDTEIGHAKERQEARVKSQKVEIFNHLCGLIQKPNIPLPAKMENLISTSCAGPDIPLPTKIQNLMSTSCASPDIPLPTKMGNLISTSCVSPDIPLPAKMENTTSTSCASPDILLPANMESPDNDLLPEDMEDNMMVGSCVGKFQIGNSNMVKNWKHLYGSENIEDWKSIPYGLELQKAGVELNMAKEFKDNLYKIGRWMTIPYAIEFQEAGIEFDKAKKFKDLHDPNRNDNKELSLKKELYKAGVEFNKVKRFMRLHALREIEHWNIHGATELEEAGIKFKKAEKCNMFSIKFNNGLMEISPLSIEDHTETYLRNLIAYEQYCYGDNGFDFDFVTNYVCFMDYLINSPKDVELLRRRRIICNFLGDDEVTSTMVSKLGHYITVSNSNSMYARTSMEVNMHCNRRRNVWMAKLKHDYFNSPWALISFLAAVLLLALAIVQTIFSIIP